MNKKYEFQERYLLYCSAHNLIPEETLVNFSGHKYTFWVDKLADEYKKINNIRRINNQDDFTNFIKSKIKEQLCNTK